MSYEKNQAGFLHSRICEGCNRFKWCEWVVTGQFEGTWRCAGCQQKDNDALADVVKAVKRRIDKTSIEKGEVT